MGPHPKPKLVVTRFVLPTFVVGKSPILSWYSPYQNQLGFRLNSTLFDNKEWPSTLLHGQISASRTALFFRIITISMFTFTD